MSLLIFLYMNTIWFLGGLLTGLTSFGGNLLAIPLLTLVIPARKAILLGCLSGAVILAGLVFIYRRDVAWLETVGLGLTGLLGVPLGNAFLYHAGPRLLLLAAGGSLVLFLLWQFLSGRLHASQKPVSAWWALPCGFLGGTMMSAVGMGGPPLVLYAYLRHWSKEATLGGANLSALITMLGVLAVQWAGGLYTAEILRDGLVGGLFGILGIVASVPIVRKVHTLLFRRLLLLMLALSAFMLLVRGCVA